jgi:hypothetical protein
MMATKSTSMKVALMRTYLTSLSIVALLLLNGSPTMAQSLEETFAFIESGTPLSAIKRTGPNTVITRTLGSARDYTAGEDCRIEVVEFYGKARTVFELNKVIVAEIKSTGGHVTFPGNDGDNVRCRHVPAAPGLRELNMCHSDFSLSVFDRDRFQNAVKYLFTKLCKGTRRRSAF